MISEEFVTKVLTDPVARGTLGSDGITSVYARSKAARRGDPLHALYRQYANARKLAEKQRGTPPSWSDTLWKAGIRASCDVIPWIEAHPLPPEFREKPAHPFTIYPAAKAAKEGDPFNALYLDYNRRRKADARRGRFPLTWREALAKAGVKTKEDAQKYIAAWRATHEG